jgi:hypothetical protein
MPGMTRVRCPRERTYDLAVLRASRKGPGRRADELAKEATLRH